MLEKIKIHCRRFRCLLIILISFFLLRDIRAAESTKGNCPGEQIYLHKQVPVKINTNCELGSNLNFRIPDNLTTIKIFSKTSFQNIYQTHLKIPKAKID